MNRLLLACENASEYPLNLQNVSTQYLPQQLGDIAKRFVEKQSKLLCQEFKTAVDFLQSDYVGQRKSYLIVAASFYADFTAAFSQRRVSNLLQLKEVLRSSSSDKRYDPLCRFMYVSLTLLCVI